VDRLGDFRLRKRLAVGGMGEVYLGEKIGPEGFVKPVVLKCVLPQLAKDRAFVQLFLDEARLAALLNHPNIAQVYDFGLVDDIYYIAMEYVPGYTVDDIRRKLKSIGQFMPLPHIACIASQACQGLHYAHNLTDANGVGLGLVHRDVSPHNLIVSIDGSVKLVDFGIAKARAGLTRVQAKGAVGKFGYMSPEQSRGEVVDGRSDIFSLGICLWEMATNERLHDPNLDRAPDYSPTRPIKSIEVYRREVPRQFGEIVETALGIEAADRYRTCQDMHLSLERFQAAMTHYAGQAALAQYIKDLVEGRVENPAQTASGNTVEAVGAGKRTTSAKVSMDAAQKYEEVFGVTMERARPRPSLRAVPKSWETKEPSRPPEPAPAPHGSRPGNDKVPEVDAKDIPTGDLPDLAEPVHTPAQRKVSVPSPKPQAVPRPPSSKAPFVAVAVLVVLGAAGAGAYYKREELVALVKPKAPVPAQTLKCIYRIESNPPGATVVLDGQPAAQPTPVEVEMIPEVEYQLTIMKEKFATKMATVKASVSADVQRLPFTLEPAATLKVTSIPPGASVSIDTRTIDDKVTPMVIDDVPADREISVKCEITGMPAETLKVKVQAGKTKAVSCNLTKS
jgi:serine/threonine-protein kinase